MVHIMRSTSSALLLALALVVTACGGGDANGSTDTTAAPTGGGAGDPAVVIDGFAFVDIQDVAVGEEVVVANRDATGHTWTSNDGTFDSGTIAGGNTFSFVFDTPGEYRFFCGIHPTMTGSITVTG